MPDGVITKGTSRNSVVELVVQSDRQGKHFSVYVLRPSFTLFTVIVVFADIMSLMFDYFLLEKVSYVPTMSLIIFMADNLRIPFHKHFVPHLTGELRGGGQPLHCVERVKRTQAYEKPTRTSNAGGGRVNRSVVADMPSEQTTVEATIRAS